MLRKLEWKKILPVAFIAALLFTIFAFFFIKKADYDFSWLLYLGSVCFFFTIATFVVINKPNENGMQTKVMPIFMGVITTLTGVIISVLLCFISLMVLIPGFIENTPVHHLLQNEPAAAMKGRTNGLVFKVFFAAVLLNFFGGSIASVILSFYQKGKDKK